MKNLKALSAILGILVIILAVTTAYYATKPVPVPPELAELEAKVSELEAGIADKEARISELEATLAAIPPKPFEGIRVRFFCGGTPGGPYETVVYKGALLAEETLGCKVDYVWSDWSPEKMIAQFKDAVAAMPDAIVVMGHPGDEAFKPLIDDAVKKGIIVYTTDTDLPETRGEHFAEGFGCVWAEMYHSGYILCKEAVKRFDLKEGDSALVVGLLRLPARGMETRGGIDAFEEAGLTVDYIEISPDVDKDPSLGTPILTAYIAAHPDLKVIYLDHAGMTATTETYIKTAGKAPGEINVVGFCLSPPTIDAIKHGYLSLILDKQQFLMGYLSIVNVCLTKKYGFSGLYIDTGSGFVDKTNVDFMEPLVKEGYR